MKQVRRGAFETNSSSMHSITIANSEGLLDTLSVNEDGVVILYSGEFGWGIDTYWDAATKAAYCWQDTGEDSPEREMLVRVILDQTGAKEVMMLSNDDTYWSEGYIDHQSVGTTHSEGVFESEETVRQFIFNPKSKLRIDNDNH